MTKSKNPLDTNSCWVVVADEYQSTFYAREEKSSALEKISSIRNDDARKNISDMISDRGGRSFDSHGQHRHTMEKSDPKSHSAVVFAKRIGKRLSDAKQGKKYHKLVVIAPPRFLGVLRTALETAGVDIDRSFDKELTDKKPAFIQKMLDSK